jgi:ABC-type antimicrobial peptide transport system permease subunit
MISGALPAIQASKIKPVEALRYEWKALNTCIF